MDMIIKIIWELPGDVLQAWENEASKIAFQKWKKETEGFQGWQ